MDRVQYRLGVGAAALLIVALAGTVMAADIPAPPAEAASGSTAPAATPSEPMPKAIATATAASPAIVTLASPSEAVRSLGPASVLRITVRPDAVAKGEPYLVNVYTVPAPGTPGLAPTTDQAQTLVGSFAFFPPPREGEVRTFTLPTPDASAVTGPDVTLKVELVPTAPDSKLETSTLAIIEANIGAE
jgi:hypothetical protein